MIGVLALAAVLNACTKADTKPDGVNGPNRDDVGNATFVIKSFPKAGYSLLQAQDIFRNDADGAKRATNWRIPREAVFTFGACIEDASTHADARGHNFNVEMVQAGRKIKIGNVTPTRPNGCFTWMETIPFSYFVKQSRWVVLVRDIVGTGIHSGRQRIRIAVNPWAIGDGARDGGEPVVYLRDDNVHASQLYEGNDADKAFSGEGLGEDQLFVDDVSIQTIRRGERDSGTLLSMNISMEPKVRFEGAGGTPQFKKINTGDFQIRGHLVLNQTGPTLKERVILTTTTQFDEAEAKEGRVEISGVGKVIDGKLIARLNAWVDPRLRQGNLELVLKVIPTVRGLKAFGGIYELGALRNLSSSASGSLTEGCRNENGCDTGAYLRSAHNYEAVRANSLASSGSPYLFDRLRLRFVQVQPGETTTQRNVAYSASTCVVDAFTGDRVVGLGFQINYKSSKEPAKTVTTAEDGCLNWDSNIFHQYYMPEEFIEQSVTITKGTGVSRDLKFYINPWDDKFTFGFDEREFTQQFWTKLRTRKKIPSRFFMSEFGYHTVRFQYNIDSLMNLEVRKTVLMELQPQVLRYSGIINARKMTESLRDGIWLLKVGIQKNYLDPAQAGVVIDKLQDNQSMVRMVNEPGGAQQQRSLNRLRKLGIEATTKEYISTETALVRVTDGVIIQPVELSMQDLRLMRIRKNFLVQLEAVDERKLQVDNALHRGMQEELEKLLEERRKAEQDRQDRRRTEGTLPDEAAETAREEARIREKFEARRQTSRRVFDYINKQLNATGAFQVNWDELRLDDEQKKYITDLLGYNRRFDETEDPNSLKKKLETNDFTELKLPACSDVDCNSFSEVNSGLQKRTFVGPVIFLHNAYKDSVRATDNLDEAKCGQRVDIEDRLEAELRSKERTMFMDTDSRVDGERQNSLYKFSEYFGSLRHLCFSHVDDLIRREREDRLLYEKSGPAVGSVYEFAKNYGLEFLSLSDEKLKSVEISPESIRRCNGDLVSCMRETDERWVPAGNAINMLNMRLHDGLYNMGAPLRWWSDNPDDMKSTPWSLEDLRSALFDSKNPEAETFKVKSPRAERFAACSILTTRLLQGSYAAGAKPPHHPAGEKAFDEMVSRCMSTGGQPIVMDRKLRVYKTGQDGDSYIFLGGLQLNLNVGQSFSVSRSDSWSYGYGVELFDFIGWGGGRAKAVGMIAKPVNFKVGKSHSLGSSDGTSVSDSTYLVAQIARFKVRLDDYEQCVVLRFNHDFLDRMKFRAGAGFYRFFSENMAIIEKHSGLLVCEGVRQTKPRYVKEDYFYFTQHFTEGDMLDQADLYNHPWLLALRGQRDFGTFLHAVRAQEVVSFGNFVNGALPGGGVRNIGWPLEQMLKVYKHITPSFPGFYTVLEENEEMTQFPLERRMSKTDQDINAEVISRDRRVPRNQRQN